MNAIIDFEHQVRHDLKSEFLNSDQQDLPIQRYGHIVATANQVLYLEANENYTFVHMCHGQPILLARTIAHFELPYQNFVRISRKHVVNVNHLIHRCFGPHNNSVCMINGTILPISRRKVKQVKEAFGMN
jgi:DNA-binding LytR/AlgR family response regulator